jgi:hypothetical protein
MALNSILRAAQTKNISPEKEDDKGNKAAVLLGESSVFPSFRAEIA